ncbi:hypothetical protein PCCS19_47050 [Paenibacillus sp. CCS19]|nr:hypothetical protein PCCS19_47050 [Paenibacillus cellulosilyticus]
MSNERCKFVGLTEGGKEGEDGQMSGFIRFWTKNRVVQVGQFSPNELTEQVAHRRFYLTYLHQ